jgi:uncharacterized repeat protein (TIGR03806 family)
MRHTVLSPSGLRSSGCVARPPALLVVAVAAGLVGCVSQGGAAADAATSMDDASRPDVAINLDAGMPDDGADAGSWWPCAPPSDPTQPRGSLADTGCMDEVNVTSFAASAHVYELNSPLWSDGSDKERAFVLPPGGKIHVVSCAVEPSACVGMADDGKWVFPVGTTLVKSFGFDGKLVETRLLVAVPDGTWVGYSYQWNEAQTGATLVGASGASVSFNTGSRTVDWTYPSRRDCTECHTRSAGWSLGPEMAQMNRTPISTALGTQNQIDRFAAANLFDVAPAKPYKTALVTPVQGQLGGPSSSATVSERARSYIHANCAFCHRPDGEFRSVDLRYDTTFKDTMLCNAIPTKGTLGADNTTNLTPGHPERSTIWLRMNTLGSGRMPPLASAVLDQDAVDLVGEWIQGVQACP